MCVSCCYNIFPAEDPGEDILDGWEAGRGHHRRINLPVGAGGVFKKRKCYSKKIVHKYSQNRKERMPVMYIQKLYQFSILYHIQKKCAAVMSRPIHELFLHLNFTNLHKTFILPLPPKKCTTSIYTILGTYPPPPLNP